MKTCVLFICCKYPFIESGLADYFFLLILYHLFHHHFVFILNLQGIDGNRQVTEVVYPHAVDALRYALLLLPDQSSINIVQGKCCYIIAWHQQIKRQLAAERVHKRLYIEINVIIA